MNGSDRIVIGDLAPGTSCDWIAVGSRRRPTLTILQLRKPRIVTSRPRSGGVLPAASVALCSLAGAVVFPVSDLGRAAPSSISRAWLLELGMAWMLLAVWALAFAAVLKRAQPRTKGTALSGAAMAHLPLLLCLGLVGAVYLADTANHAYSVGPYRAVYQALAKGYVLLAPATAQAVLLALPQKRYLLAAAPLGAIVVLGAVLRFASLDWALPAVFHYDEPKYVGRAYRILELGDFNPRYFENPSLMIYVDYLLIRLLSPHVQTFYAAAELLGTRLNDPRWDVVIYYAARSLSAGAGALTAIPIYLAARPLFGRPAGLLAGLLLAVSFLHVRDSHFATNDVAGTLLLAWSFFFAVRIHQQGKTRDYLLAGALAGIATSAKYNMGMATAAILVAHLLRMRGQGGALARPATHLPLALAALASIAGFVAGTPYSVLDPSGFLGGFRSQYGYGGSPAVGQDDRLSPILYAEALAWGFGVVPLLLASVGALLAARQLPAHLVLALSIPAAYLGFMVTQQLFFARFANPLLPFLAMLAGYATVQIASLARRPSHKRLVLASIALLAVAQPAALSVQFDALLSRVDTRVLAAAWIDAHTPSDERVAVETNSAMDGWYGWGTGRLRSTWIFRSGNPADTDEILSGKFRYLVASSNGYGTWLNGALAGHDLPGPYRRISDEATLVAIFYPSSKGELPYNLDDTFTPLWYIAERERPGPTVRVYRVDRAIGG